MHAGLTPNHAIHCQYRRQDCFEETGTCTPKTHAGHFGSRLAAMIVGSASHALRLDSRSGQTQRPTLKARSDIVFVPTTDPEGRALTKIRPSHAMLRNAVKNLVPCLGTGVEAQCAQAQTARSPRYIFLRRGCRASSARCSSDIVQRKHRAANLFERQAPQILAGQTWRVDVDERAGDRCHPGPMLQFSLANEDLTLRRFDPETAKM